jgi:hypothetical protein
MVMVMATATVAATATAATTATAKVTMWEMMMVTRLVGDEEGKGKGSKGFDDSNEGGGQ